MLRSLVGSEMCIRDRLNMCICVSGEGLQFDSYVQMFVVHDVVCFRPWSLRISGRADHHGVVQMDGAPIYMFLASSGLQQHPPGLTPRKLSSRPVMHTEQPGNRIPQMKEAQQDSSSWNLSDTLQRRHMGKHPPTHMATMHIPQLWVSALPSRAAHWRPIWQQGQKRVSQQTLVSSKQPQVPWW
eukprot:TRINITY_DN1776_c0_g1_i6.p1 TRINITY_DN1776_c0_g1~~TRINITY_DN1776_c0_g1_i6.p1  ORF type:complete len:199 (+),score=45.98 TRINITY_DN1776_c0_g1_i6:46-597(+)